MTPQIGEIWLRKKPQRPELREVVVCGFDKDCILIKDIDEVHPVSKELWNEHFAKKEETNQTKR